ncbi:hypothetical protein [Streptomyces sp. NPDC057325]|uniref:hypothetical protein n=1 Tax=unclassified Streptomyces TaxID=2593676 RepID=UPI00363DBD81
MTRTKVIKALAAAALAAAAVAIPVSGATAADEERVTSTEGDIGWGAPPASPAPTPPVPPAAPAGDIGWG